jgi:uncharacterized protein (TIGR03067 family)
MLSGIVRLQSRRNKMRCVFCFVVLVLPLVTRAEERPDDLTKLQGEWRVLASASGDKETTNVRLTFSRNKMALKLDNDREEAIEANFVLDAAKQLKTITFTTKSEGKKPQTPEKFLGVYKFEGNLLILHMGEKRPEDFRPADNKTILLVLEKIVEPKK